MGGWAENSTLNANFCYLGFQLSKPCFNDSKCKMESESGNNSDFDDTDYAFDISEDFLEFSSMKEEPPEVKKEKLDSGFDEIEVCTGCETCTQA